MNQQYNDLQSLFARHFVKSNTLCSVQCYCGRTHFVTAQGHGDYAPGELEGLRRAAGHHPEKYVESYLFDSIDYVFLRNEQVVVGCPCGTTDMLAAFLVEKHEDCGRFLVEFFHREADAADRKQQTYRQLAEQVELAAPQPLLTPKGTRK